MRALLHRTLIVFILFSGGFLRASQWVVDEHFSPHSSSENIISIQNQVFALQDPIRDKNHDWITRPDFENKQYLKKYRLGEMLRKSSASKYGVVCYSKMFLRALEQLFVWLPIHGTTMVAQHEIFGHGYRARDLGEEKIKVTSYLVLPIGGLTRFETKANLTPSDYLALTIGGVEANSLLANTLEKSWIRDGKIDGRQSFLWLLSHGDLPEYLSQTKDVSSRDILQNPFSGNDMISYLGQINTLYGSSQPIEDQIKDLNKRGSLSCWLNPFSYLTILANFSHIFFNSSVSLSGFSLGSLNFLPQYQLGLTPFGPENIYKGYLWQTGSSLTTFYLKEGRFADHSYRGLGIENKELWKTKYGLVGASLDLWHQPELTKRPYCFGEDKAFSLQDWVQSSSKEELTTKKWGALAALYYKYPFRQNTNNLWLQLGYKTKGYVPGESLSNHLIARLGVQVGF